VRVCVCVVSPPQFEYKENIPRYIKKMIENNGFSI